MIFPRARILLVDDCPAELDAFRRLLSREGRFHVDTAPDGEEGYRLARLHRPDLIISDYAMPGMNGFELCRKVKDDPGTAPAMFVIITGYQDTQLKVEGLNLGIDDYMTKPVEAAELFAKTRSMLRIKSLHDELRRDKAELEKVHSSLGVSYDQLQALLVHMIDLSLPGASERGARLATVSLELARMLSVPPRFLSGLEAAALLHECGKIVPPDDGFGDAAGSQSPSDWRYILASHAIMSRVDRLRDPADLVLAMFENWDGSGFPEHRRQGQIPLRSRIIRIANDFFNTLRRARRLGETVDPLGALEEIARRSGTRYDPVVVDKFKLLVQREADADWLESSYRIPIQKMVDGMVLAQDLCTNGGTKLLARGATVTESLLGVILKRHASEPIVEGALVRY